MPGRSSVDPGRQVRALAGADPVQVPHRPVQHRVGGRAVGARHGLREEHRVLVGEQVQVGVQVRRRSRSAPARAGARSAGRPRPASAGLRPERPVRDVGHHVQAERRDPGDPRVLDAGVAGAALPARVGLQHDTLAASTAGRDAVVDDRPRPARPGRRCRRPPAGAAGTARRRGRARWPGSARPRPRTGCRAPGVMTTPDRVSGYGDVRRQAVRDRRISPSRRSRDRWRRSAAGTR